MDRFERQRALFGAEGQDKLARSRVAVVGLGGLGSIAAMELAYLGVGDLTFVDHDRVEVSNRNRLVGAWESRSDGRLKVEIARELVAAIDPSIPVTVMPLRFPNDQIEEKLLSCDYVMGCLDRDGARLRLNALCTSARIPYIDAASDTLRDGDQLAYGGRVCFVGRGKGCLVCLQVLDPDEVRDELASIEQKADRDAIYGVNRELLNEAGPSVISVNGVVASLAVTELICAVTGLREPFSRLDYHGHRGVVLKSIDRGDLECYYCAQQEH